MHIFPQLRKLEQKYAAELMVIGVHSAKFPNEKEKGNLRKAVQRYELQHPVVNDADFQVWQRYACRAWPTLMFIDPRGKVIGKHEGELPYESFDAMLGQMVDRFDAQCLLTRTPVPYVRDSEPLTALSFPGKVLADGPGDRLFIADTNHNRMLVTTLEGSVRQVVGSGSAGLEDGDFITATFDHPQGMALTGDVLYVADAENHALRRVDLVAERVDTIAGNGNQGYQRDGRGPGLQMELNSPWDLAYHEDTLYIAMASTHQLWSMNLADGQIGPYAGSGRESITNGLLANATLAQPNGITTDGDRLYIADSETSAVRSAELDPNGLVRTIVGLDPFFFGDVDGPEHMARLQHPTGITIHDGVLYITDTYNHKIKQVLPVTRTVLTLLGTGRAGYQDGAGNQAMFSEPSGLSFAIREDGASPLLYIADTNNHLIRVADLQASQVSTLEITGL